MPVWIQWVLSIAALVLAVGTIYRAVIRPLWNAVALLTELLPLSRQLAAAFRDTPHAFEVLEEIVVQFRTDSGSSLRDVVNRIESSADTSRLAANALAASVAVQTELLGRLTNKVDETTATGKRLEYQADNVALNLAASNKRADEAKGEPGAAADAAVLPPAEEKP